MSGKKIFLACCFAFLCLLVSGGVAQAAGEWEKYNRAEELSRQGELAQAMALWKELVDEMQQIGENEAAGFCAQKLGRALDQLGHYEEARYYYQLEARLWDPLGHQDWTVVDKHRAETIDTKVYLFLEKAASEGAPNRTPLGKFEPARGAILGTTVARNSELEGSLARAEQVFGRPFSGVLAYVLWGDLPSEVPEVAEAKRAGAYLQLAWQPDQGLAAVKDDGYVREFIRELAEYGGPVFLRFGGEMNGDWTAWSGNAELYKEKFRLIASLVREMAPNVAMVWSPNYVPDEKVDEYYPGDQWVDWVGINAYTDYYCNGNPDMNSATATVFFQGRDANPLSKFKAIYQRYARRKPIMISETGIAWANRQPYEDVSAWGAYNLKRFYAYLPLAYPRVKAVFYFNIDLSGASREAGFSHYAVTQSPRMLAAFKEAVQSPWYLARPGESSPVIYEPVTDQLPPSGALVCYIPLGPVQISRVEYWFGDALVGTSSSPPWRLTYGEGQIAGGGTLKIVAYGENGRPVLTADFPVKGETIPPVSIWLDGRQLATDAEPVLSKEGRLLVPARAVLEQLGVQVEWDEPAKRVICRKGGDTVVLRIDDPVAEKNGQALPPMDVPARIIKGRTMVPLRFLLENFQAQVEWDPAARRVNITPPKGSS